MRYNIDVVVTSSYYFEDIEAESKDQAKGIALDMIYNNAPSWRRKVDFDVCEINRKGY